MNNCLIIAGERSGEDHALSFLPDLMKRLPDYSFWGVGGDAMKDMGVELRYHLKDFSSWGFSEVIGKIPFYKKALKNIESEVERRDCKVAILIDFQGFNMRLAKRLKEKNVKVLYYVAPQAWAWKPGRVKTLRKCVHTLFTIIPFEKKWFRERGVKQVVSVSHPLWNSMSASLEKNKEAIESKSFHWLKENKRILLLPGSRNFEVQALLPIFLKAVQSLNFDCELAIVKSANVDEHLYSPYIHEFDYIYNDSHLDDALSWAGVAMAASGTVTLSCALFGVPTVVAYKSSLLNEFIFFNIINYNGPITLANIVHEYELFPELVQNRATVFNCYKELCRLFENEGHYETMRSELLKTGGLIRGDHDECLDHMLKAFE